MKKEEFITKKYFEKSLDKKLTQHAQIIVAAVDTVLEKRLTNSKKELEKKIDGVKNLIDGYVKNQEEFRQEFVIMKEETKQIKKVLKENLEVEIQAI